MLQAGDTAPDITLQTDSGESVSLSSYRGRKVVLYFYPRADTPGCTTEACEFRDLQAGMARKNAVIIGVSPDTVAAQAKFKAKYELPFTLFADAGKSAAEAFGVWKEKNMYGRKVMGIERSTFIIDEQGKITRVFPKVRAKGHAEAVLATL